MRSNLYSETPGVFTGSPANNLAKGLPGFLGRETEVLQVKKQLNEKHLVILQGVDGAGKTRLAIQIADELAGQFQDGVLFLSFESVVLPEFIIDALATTLGISLHPRSDSAEQFLAALSTKSLLLVLDSFETIPQHTPLLKEIKARAPLVRTIVTTSAPLDLADEFVLELHGLPMPGREESQLESSPSVQLFLEHARVYPDSELDLEAIGHICRLVDGMPLAIEFAAAWTTILSCEQVAQRIEESFSLHPADRISGESQSMLAIFDAVWNLLAENEKRILLGLSAFRGGFSHRAATKITGTSYFFLDELLNKRIIRPVQYQRYVLHPSFSNFLHEKLEANPVLATDVEIRHGSFFLGLLRDSEYSLSQSTASVLEEILFDVDNIRLAWKRTVAAGNLRLTQSALAAWITVLESRGWFPEALNALETLGMRLSESLGDLPETTLFYIQVKKSLGQLHYQLKDYEAGIRELQEAFRHIEGKDLSQEESEVCRLLGDHFRAAGLFENSREMYRHALVCAEKTGNLFLIYQSIDSLADQAFLESDYPGAVATAEHALEIARQLEDKGKIAESQANLGRLYIKLNDQRRAKELLSDALAFAPDGKGQHLKSSILELLGKTLIALNEYGQAFPAFAMGLRSAKEEDSVALMVEMLVDIAVLFDRTKDKALALTLVGLLMDHPAAGVEAKRNAALLYKTLTAENVQPEKRDWTADQLEKVAVDLIAILEERAAGK